MQDSFKAVAVAARVSHMHCSEHNTSKCFNVYQPFWHTRHVSAIHTKTIA